MMGYWTRFAKTDDPNGAGAVTSPKYDAGDTNIALADAITTSTGLKKAECNFWDGP